MNTLIDSPAPVPPFPIVRVGLALSFALLIGSCSVSLLVSKFASSESKETNDRGRIYSARSLRPGTVLYTNLEKFGTVLAQDKDSECVAIVTPERTVEIKTWGAVEQWFRTTPNDARYNFPEFFEHETPAVAAQPVAMVPVPAKPQSVEEAQRLAIQKYPELAVPKSVLNQRFTNKVRAYQVSRPQMFTDPGWPLAVADEVATR